MYRSTLFILLSLWITVSKAADDNPLHINLGLGLVDNDLLVTPQNTALDDRFIPSVSIGIGYDYPVAQNWLMETSLTLEHAQGDAIRQDVVIETQTPRLENTGLWIDSTLKYTAMFEDVNPFISVGAGRLYGQYDDGATRISGWETGYRAFAGFEFTLSEDVSLSLALGHIDTGELD